MHRSERGQRESISFERLLTPGNVPTDSGHLFGGVDQRQGLPEPPPNKNEEEMNQISPKRIVDRHQTIYSVFLKAVSTPSLPPTSLMRNRPFCVSVPHSLRTVHLLPRCSTFPASKIRTPIQVGTGDIEILSSEIA